jgi:sec-independent protein translocase protein TatC
MSKEQGTDRQRQADEAAADSAEDSSRNLNETEGAGLSETPVSGSSQDPAEDDLASDTADQERLPASESPESSEAPDVTDPEPSDNPPESEPGGGKSASGEESLPQETEEKSAGVQVRGETSAAEAKPEDGAAEEEPVHEMTFTEHLNELRVRLVRCLIAVFIGFLACYGFSEQLFVLLMQPLITLLEPSGGSLIYTGLPEAFFTHIKVAALAGLFVASPYVFYQLWMFIAPGLYEGERKYMIPIALCSALCFVTGALFGYFIVFPFGFQFFLGYASEMIQPMPSVKEYFSFSTSMLFAFGLIFELPLFMFFLSALGVVNYKSLRKYRKFAILGSFVVAAVLTPPDIVSQSLMAGPMCLLYEVGIWVSYMFGKKPKESPEDEADASQAKV